MARRQNHPAAIRETYPRRLKGIRKRRDMTLQQLASALAEIGFPINRTSISKIESGRRPMEVSEMVAFATVLDVPPAALYLPLDAKTVALTKNRTVDFEKAASWAAEEGPLDPANERTYLLESPTFSARAHLPIRATFRTRGVVTTPEGEERP